MLLYSKGRRGCHSLRFTVRVNRIAQNPATILHSAFCIFLPVPQIHRPVLNGLGDVLGLDFLAAVQIGYRSGDF